LTDTNENPNDTNRFWPSYDSLDEAQEATSRGATAGIVLLVLKIIGIAVLSVLGPDRRAELLGEQMSLMEALITQGIDVAIIAFFSWRIYSGKGYVSAILLILLAIYMAISALLTGTFLVPIVIGMAVVPPVWKAIPATLAYKRLNETETDISVF